MCTNYAAARRDQLFKHFGIEPPESPWRDEVYRDYPAPIIRRSDDAARADVATFGIMPRARMKEGAKDFSTMNARTETVAEKYSFKFAWATLQFCLIPCTAFYEPYYATAGAKSVRWKIGMADGEPFALAGLWREWKNPEAFSFTMLTINSAEHPLMKRFHKPDDEKRSVVIVPPSEYENWLACSSTEEARSFLNLYPADGMRAEECPAPPRKSKEPAST